MLKIRSVMDPFDSTVDHSPLKISQDAIIETVAEAVLAKRRPVPVVDADGKMVGSVTSSKMIHLLFGKEDAEVSG